MTPHDHDRRQLPRPALPEVGPDGELAALNLELVLLRFAEVDQDGSALAEGTLGA